MKLNTVFVYFNVVNGMVTGAEHQLDCAYVRSFLEKKGIKTAQYIAHRTTRISQFMMQIKDYSAELYVFFINEYNYYISSIVIHHLKENDKNVKIAVLGPVVKHLSQSSLRTKTIDYYIIGNPYEAIMQIVQGIQKDKIVNICYWLEDKFIINEQKRIEIFMDELGGIYSSGIVPYEEAGNIGLLTSRGCFGRCTFCSYVKNSFEKAHSIDFLLNELDYISTMTNNSPIGLSFFDDCFSLNTGRSIKICEEVSKRQYNMRFWCCTRADVLNTELIDKMALCNFRNIVIGMETASVDLLQNSGKVVNGESSAQYLEQIKENFIYARNKGLEPVLSMLIGMPGEKKEDFIKTVDWVKNIRAERNISLCFLTCFPESKVFDYSEQLDMHIEKGATGLPYKTFYKNYDIKKAYRKLRSVGILSDEVANLYEKTREYRKKLIDSISGQYSTMNIETGLSIIMVDDCPKAKVINFIGDNLSMDGMLIVQKESLQLTDKSLYSEDRKRLKIPILDYDEILKEFYNHNKYISHIALSSKGNPINYIVDNIYSNDKILLPVKDVHSSYELDIISDAVHKMVSENYILFRDVKQGVQKNSCRFCGRCSIATNTRVIACEDGVKLCNEYSQDTIQFTQGKRELMNLIQKERVNVMVERKCIECEAKMHCAKCISLPHWMSKKMYCDFVKQNKFLGTYLSAISFVNRMLDNVNQYNDEDKIEIFFSKKEDMILQHTFALKFDSEMMILNINSQKYLPVSRLEEKYIMSGFNTQIDYWEKLDTEEKSYFEMLNGRGIIFLEKKGGQSI